MFHNKTVILDRVKVPINASMPFLLSLYSIPSITSISKQTTVELFEQNLRSIQQEHDEESDIQFYSTTTLHGMI